MVQYLVLLGQPAKEEELAIITEGQLVRHGHGAGLVQLYSS